MVKVKRSLNLVKTKNMKKQILTLIFLIITSIGFSQLPTLTKTSNLTPITINNNDTLLVPIGDSVWINGIDAWNTANIGDVGNFYLIKTDLITWVATYIDTIVIGNNDKYRFKITVPTKYRYAIRRQFEATPDLYFYIRGTVGVTSGTLDNSVLSPSIKIYPNPTSDQLNISGLLTTQKLISITNVIGEVVKTVETNSNQSLNIDIENLSPGVYFIVANNRALKFIKE